MTDCIICQTNQEDGDGVTFTVLGGEGVLIMAMVKSNCAEFYVVVTDWDIPRSGSESPTVIYKGRDRYTADRTWPRLVNSIMVESNQRIFSRIPS